MMPPSISLTPLHVSELENFYTVCQDTELRKYLMEGMEMTFDDCQNLIFANDEFVSKNKIGLYLIKLTGEIIGYGGFKKTYPVSDKIDFIYAISGKYFGQGLGAQIAGDLIAKFKESCCFANKITAVVNPKNIASIKILEKYNFILKGFAEGELDHLYLYELYIWLSDAKVQEAFFV